MSGSGGGRGDDYPPPTPARPVGATSQNDSGGGGGEDPCNVVQRAPLNSPQAAIIATISVGDALDVVLNTSGPRPVLEVRAPAGVAGALTHRGHVTIIQCIEAGRSYLAVVLSKTGGAVEVRIQPT